MTDTVKVYVPSARPGRSWYDCPRAQQAGMLCNAVEFREWIHAADKDAAAEIVRRICGVESRSELDRDDVAGGKFDTLAKDYFFRFELASLEASMRDGPGYEPEPVCPPKPVVKPSRKRVLILTTLNVGYWPWLNSLALTMPLPILVKSGRKFTIGDISISSREHETLLGCGLLMPFLDDENAFTITDLGREWLRSYWAR